MGRCRGGALAASAAGAPAEEPAQSAAARSCLDSGARWRTGARGHRPPPLLQRSGRKRASSAVSHGPRRDDEQSLADASTLREASIGNQFFEINCILNNKKMNKISYNNKEISIIRSLRSNNHCVANGKIDVEFQETRWKECGRRDDGIAQGVQHIGPSEQVIVQSGQEQRPEKLRMLSGYWISPIVSPCYGEKQHKTFLENIFEMLSLWTARAFLFLTFMLTLTCYLLAFSKNIQKKNQKPKPKKKLAVWL